MTFQRDIAWQQHDLMQQSSVAYHFARYALGLTYDMMPADVVHQAKRCLLDGLGCAIGAYDAPGRPICEETAKELGGHSEATVFVSGLRTSASNATLVNSFMIRFLDFNDMGGGGHNSDAIPGVLAIAEREKASGRDFLTAMVVTYELGSRVTEAITSWSGWIHDMRSTLTMPAALGKLLGLNPDQIANAIGICASGNSALAILDTAGEERVMRKNLRFGWGSCAAIVSCLLAKRGFTGPIRVVEGERGMSDVMFNGKVNIERLTDFRGWRIMFARFKYLCANASLQSLLGATLDIVRDNDIKPEDIAAVKIKMTPSANAIRPTVSIVYPRNAETADHSAYYLTAVAIKEREVTADSIRPELFTDPVILDLIQKIVVEGDASMPPPAEVKYVSGVGHEGKAEITTQDGRTFKKHIVHPHGYWGAESLTDKELEEKFLKLAVPYIGEAQARKLIDAVWNVERLKDIGELVKLTVAAKQ